MEYTELKHAIDGIHAYDTGCVDSGIKDELLRQRVKNHMRSLAPVDHRRVLSNLVIDLCLSDRALSEGYGPEDAKELLEWLDDQGILIAA